MSFFQKVIENPYAWILFFFIGLQMAIMIISSYINMVRQNRYTKAMEKTYQDSEARVRDILKTMESNRKDLINSINRVDEIMAQSAKENPDNEQQ